MKSRDVIDRLATSITLAWVLLLCSSTLQASSSRATTPNTVLPEVEVWVEGPWAYADDPRDAQRIVLIAPDSDSIQHTHAAVAHSAGDRELDSDSVLEIRNLTHTQQACSTCTINAYQVDVDRRVLTDLLGSRTGRYVISLPKPDRYEQAVGQESRVRSRWWDDCRPRQNCGGQPLHTTQVIFHYTVSALEGFSIGPTAQQQTTLSFEDRHVITIFMTPKGEIDQCDSVGRLAFHHLVRLFSLNLYVDLRTKIVGSNASTGPYPSDDPPGLSTCLDSDPQNPRNNDPQNPTYQVTRSIAAALNDLANYFRNPDQGSAVQARAECNQIHHYRNLVPTDTDRQQFDNSMAILNDILTGTENRQTKNAKLDSVVLIRALDNLEVVRRRIVFHNGSGACRNPILQVNAV
jgi:hypothetical protein